MARSWLTDNAGAPDATFDAAAGYIIGDCIRNTAASPIRIHMCVDPSDGAAVWLDITDVPITDHGAMGGLADDDHTQYVLATGTRAMAALQVTGRARADEQAVAFSQTLAIDLSQGNKFAVAPMTANITSLTLSNGVAGQYAELILEQDATGGRTLSGVTGGTGVSAVRRPVGEVLTPHSASGAITRYTIACDDDGAGGVIAYLRRQTDSAWEAA